MPNIEDDIRKAGKRLKALRKTASAHNKANRIFVYKRDGQNVSEDWRGCVLHASVNEKRSTLSPMRSV